MYWGLETRKQETEMTKLAKLDRKAVATLYSRLTARTHGDMPSTACRIRTVRILRKIGAQFRAAS